MAYLGLMYRRAAIHRGAPSYRRADAGHAPHRPGREACSAMAVAAGAGPLLLRHRETAPQGAGPRKTLRERDGRLRCGSRTANASPRIPDRQRGLRCSLAAYWVRGRERARAERFYARDSATGFGPRVAPGPGDHRQPVARHRRPPRRPRVDRHRRLVDEMAPGGGGPSPGQGDLGTGALPGSAGTTG